MTSVVSRIGGATSSGVSRADGTGGVLGATGSLEVATLEVVLLIVVSITTIESESEGVVLGVSVGTGSDSNAGAGAGDTT